MRRRWLGVAGVCVVIVAGTGYAVSSGGGYSCDEAVPQVDGAGIRADLPVFHQPADLVDGLVAVVEDEADRDAFQADAGVVLDPGAPLPTPSLVVLDPQQWWIGPDEDMYLADGLAGAGFTVTMHDGDDGQLRWARGQEGTAAGGGLADDGDFLLMQTETDRPLSVAVVDPGSGEVRACTPVGTAEAGAVAERQIPLSVTIDDKVVLAQPGDDDRPSTLYLVDPYPVGGGEAGLVALDAATGQTRWRIPDRTARLDQGAVVADQLLLPGLSFQGLEVVDIGDGQSRTAMDGLSVGQINSTGAAIGVEVHIGDLQAVARYELE